MNLEVEVVDQDFLGLGFIRHDLMSWDWEGRPKGKGGAADKGLPELLLAGSRIGSVHGKSSMGLTTGAGRSGDH